MKALSPLKPLSSKIVSNIIGNKRFGGKNDWDFDGVKNKKDCRPRNTMRQDKVIYAFDDRVGGLRFEERDTNLSPGEYITSEGFATAGKWITKNGIKIYDMDDSLVGFGKNKAQVKKAVINRWKELLEYE